MDVFAFRNELVTEYARFSRSFTKIRADDITKAIDAAYGEGHFWPDPLVQINPNFEPGGLERGVMPDLSAELRPRRPTRSRHSSHPANPKRWSSRPPPELDAKPQRRFAPCSTSEVGTYCSASRQKASRRDKM